MPRPPKGGMRARLCHGRPSSPARSRAHTTAHNKDTPTTPAQQMAPVVRRRVTFSVRAASTTPPSHRFHGASTTVLLLAEFRHDVRTHTLTTRSMTRQQHVLVGVSACMRRSLRCNRPARHSPAWCNTSCRIACPRRLSPLCPTRRPSAGR